MPRVSNPVFSTCAQLTIASSPLLVRQPADEHHHAHLRRLRCASLRQQARSRASQFHFLAGYTSKTPGTEDGVLEPLPTFSTCYSAPFLVCHPSRYATMLAEKMEATKANCWLINTGWTGGKYGTGRRCPLKYTRAIIDAIHDGSLAQAGFVKFDVFGLWIPTTCNVVPEEILDPRKAWSDKAAFQKEVRKLGAMFRKAFSLYEREVLDKVKLAGPVN